MRDGRSGRSPPTDVVCVVWGGVLVAALLGAAPLPPGAARPLDSPHYTWGRMRRDSFFPLQTFRPAPRAGVGMVCGCGNAAFAALAGYVAHCASLCSHPAARAKRSIPRSAASRAIRQRDERPRNAKTRKRQFAPTTRTKAVFSLESEGFLFDKTKRNLSELGRRASPCFGMKKRSGKHRSVF